MAIEQHNIGPPDVPLIYEGVQIGSKCCIEPQSIIGIKPSSVSKFLPTQIGDQALIRAGSILYHGNKIGDYFQTGNRVNIRESNRIGDNVSVGTLSVVEHQVVIEDDVRLHSQVFIPEFTHLKKGCWIGPQAVLTNAPYPGFLFSKEHLRPIIVEENAKIGANATLLPGLTIGRGALVAAGAVVTRNVEPNSVVAGSPAKVIGEVDEQKFLHKLLG